MMKYLHGDSRMSIIAEPMLRRARHTCRSSRRVLSCAAMRGISPFAGSRLLLR
jgi:hypothetical protein